jgi:hypothetical protein
MKSLRWALYAVLVILVGSTFWGWASQIHQNVARPAPESCSWRPARSRADIDTYLIHYGIVKHPDFASTLHWWVGPWGPGELPIPGHEPNARVSFYRPVSSTAFWLQWRLHGDNENLYVNWTYFGGMLYILLFLLTLTQIYRRFNGDTTHLQLPILLIVGYLLLINGYGFNPVGNSALDLVIGRWKNLPDLLAGVFMLLAILMYLSIPRMKNPTWTNLLWIVPLYLACGSKEVVILLPLALPLLDYQLWKSGSSEDRRNAGIRLLVALGYFALFNGLRLVALGGAGYRYGSNDYWLVRLVSGITYPWGPVVMRQDALQLGVSLGTFLAISVYALMVHKKVRWTRSVATSFAYFVGCLLVICALLPHLIKDLEPPALSILLATGFLIALGLIGQLTIALVASPFLLVYLWKHQRAWLWFGIAWIILTGIPNIFSPGLSHRDFVPSIGWAMLYGSAIAGIIGQCVEYWAKKGRKSQEPSVL